jgi:hypothetical protein
MTLLVKIVFPVGNKNQAGLFAHSRSPAKPLIGLSRADSLRLL